MYCGLCLGASGAITRRANLVEFTGVWRTLPCEPKICCDILVIVITVESFILLICRMVHGFTCAGVLPLQYTSLTKAWALLENPTSDEVLAMSIHGPCEQGSETVHAVSCGRSASSARLCREGRGKTCLCTCMLYSGVMMYACFPSGLLMPGMIPLRMLITPRFRA